MKIIKEICLIVLIISIPFFHEVGHLIGYILTKVPATIEYGFITSEKITVGGVLGGLLFNIIVSLISLILIRFNNKNNKLWGTIGLATSLSRLFNCGFIFLLGIFNNRSILNLNDEGQLSNLLGMPIYIQYIIFLTIYIVLIILLMKNINDKKYLNRTTLKIMGYNLILTLILLN